MDRLEEIRQAEEISHTRAYTEHELFTPGSWLAKPVKTVLDLMALFEGKSNLRVLDLGCGVGRNAIPAAKALDAVIDCVDILPIAIEKLQENAKHHGVDDKIRGIVAGIDEFKIGEDCYDLILAISALEHMDSPDSFSDKLQEIRRGLRPGGVVCLIVNSGVEERDAQTGEALIPQFEVNLPTASMQNLFQNAFCGMETLKERVVLQAYDIPRENGVSHLTSYVITFISRR